MSAMKRGTLGAAIPPKTNQTAPAIPDPEPEKQATPEPKPLGRPPKRKEEATTRVTLVLPKSVHKTLKHLATDYDTSLQDIIEGLIMEKIDARDIAAFVERLSSQD